MENSRFKFRVWSGSCMGSLSVAIERGLVGVQKNCDSSELEPCFDNVILMQYTGLKDKSGKEIYEGDILETPYERYVSEYCSSDGNSEIGLFRGQVHYRPSNGFMQAHVVRQEHDEGNDDWLKNKDLENIVQCRCEVIGNIYESPELLEDL